MPTIDHALQRFLQLEQEQHPDEFEDADLVVDNLRSYLDGYGYQYVEGGPDDEDEDFDEDDYDYDDREDDFAAAHEATVLPTAMAEFLYLWNIRTFMGSADDARATGVIVARLMELLATEGWADRTEATRAAALSRIAAEELPRAKQLAERLYDVAQATPAARREEVEDDVDDFLTIARIEPGRLWFAGDIGPIEVPEEASELAQVGWWVNLAAERRAGTWVITETGFVYPRMIEDEDDADWSDLLPETPSRD